MLDDVLHGVARAVLETNTANPVVVHEPGSPMSTAVVAPMAELHARSVLLGEREPPAGPTGYGPPSGRVTRDPVRVEAPNTPLILVLERHDPVVAHDAFTDGAHGLLTWWVPATP